MKMAIASRPAKQAIKAYSDVLNFGKHKGHTIEWLLSNHPSYILWMDENGWTVDGQIVLDAEDMDLKMNYDPRDWNDPHWWLYDEITYRD